MGRSVALGDVHQVVLPSGNIRYHERGTGEPVVFVHGILSNADLWRKVVPTIADAGYRCLAPDWPLGAHEIPVPHADLTPPGLATMVQAFLDKLDLRNVTLVANDTGGAIVQILLSRTPTRVGRVVLTPSDSYSRFLPPPLAMLPRVAAIPGSMRIVTETLRLRSLQRLPMTFGWASKRPVPPEVMDSYLQPSRHDSAIRHDLRRVFRGVNKAHTIAASTKFAQVTTPVLLAWAREDKLFPKRLAERLAKDLPHSTLRYIDDSYCFVPEDQPELLSAMILEFVGAYA